MELDQTTVATGLGAVLVTLLGVLARRGWRKALQWILSELALYVLAANERSRLRDRREGTPTARKPGEVPIYVDPDGEDTDVVRLVEKERELRARRESDQPMTPTPRLRGGTRSPRRGTHHDGED
jgi:hypothetical protein